MCQDSRSIRALVRQRGLDSVSGPGFALPRSLLCQHWRSAGAPPNTMKTRCDGISAPGVLAEPFASFELGTEWRPAAAPRERSNCPAVGSRDLISVHRRGNFCRQTTCKTRPRKTSGIPSPELVNIIISLWWLCTCPGSAVPPLQCCVVCTLMTQHRYNCEPCPVEAGKRTLPWNAAQATTLLSGYGMCV